MRRKPTWLAISSLLLLACLWAAGGALAGRHVVRSGNLVLTDDGGISPLRLPRHGVAPATARLEAEIGTVDGSHPPALRSLDMDIARNVHVDAVGLPVCRPRQIAATTSATARQVCGKALLGTGDTEVEVAFPEQAPFSSTGPLLLFNAGVHGRTTKVLLHAYVDVPAPTAIVTEADLTRIHRGPFGLELTTAIPKIAGGAGSVTKFSLHVGRRFGFKSRSRSFLTAGCPRGRWITKGKAGFADGTEMQITHVFPCTPSR